MRRDRDSLPAPHTQQAAVLHPCGRCVCHLWALLAAQLVENVTKGLTFMLGAARATQTHVHLHSHPGSNPRLPGISAFPFFPPLLCSISTSSLGPCQHFHPEIHVFLDNWEL